MQQEAYKNLWSLFMGKEDLLRGRESSYLLQHVCAWRPGAALAADVDWRPERMLQSPLLTMNEGDKLPSLSCFLRILEASQDQVKDGVFCFHTERGRVRGPGKKHGQNNIWAHWDHAEQGGSFWALEREAKVSGLG